MGESGIFRFHALFVMCVTVACLRLRVVCQCIKTTTTTTTQQHKQPNKNRRKYGFRPILLHASSHLIFEVRHERQQQSHTVRSSLFIKEKKNPPFSLCCMKRRRFSKVSITSANRIRPPFGVLSWACSRAHRRAAPAASAGCGLDFPPQSWRRLHPHTHSP